MKEDFIKLFTDLARKFGKKAVLDYITSQKEIDPQVPIRWMTNEGYAPSSGIQINLVACLRNAKDGEFPPKLVLTLIPVKAKPPKSAKPMKPNRKVQMPESSHSRGLYNQRIARIARNEELLAQAMEEACRRRGGVLLPSESNQVGG